MANTTNKTPFLSSHAKLSLVSPTNIHRLLQANLHTPFISRCSLRQVGQKVSNIIPRMPIQASPQSLLIQIMRNQSNTPTQHEQPVQHAHIQVIFSFLRAESATVTHEIDEADSDAAVDVEDQVVFFGGGDGFNGDGVLEHFAAGKAFLHEFFDEFDAQVGVIAGFYFVADSRD